MHSHLEVAPSPAFSLPLATPIGDLPQVSSDGGGGAYIV